MLRLSLFDQVRNQFPGDGGQGNAVPLVAGGEDQARQCFGGADNRGAVLTEGPQAGKCADDVDILEEGHKPGDIVADLPD